MTSEWLLRRLGQCGLTVTALMTLWLLGTNLLARRLEKRVEQYWVPFDQKLARTEPNEAAIKIDRASSELGITPFVGNVEFSARPSQARQDAFRAIQNELKSYLDAQLNTQNDTLVPLPASLRQFITTHRSTLNTITTDLVQGEQPNWGFSEQRRNDVNANLPAGLVSSLTLHQLLIGDGLEKMRQNDFSGATKAMEAAWKINQALAQDPSLIGQLCKTIATKRQAIALRKMKNLPEIWTVRLRDWQTSSPQAFLDAMQVEQLVLLRTLRQFSPSDSVGTSSSKENPSVIEKFLTAPVFYLLHPYMRASQANLVASSQDIDIRSQLLSQNFCQFKSDQFQSQLNIKMAWWNKPLAIGILLGTPELSNTGISPGISAWAKVGQEVLQVQLTQKVIQSKAIAAQQNGFPKAIPGIETSLCEGVNWRYQVAANGSLTIDFPQQSEFDSLKEDQPLNHTSTWQSQ